MKRNIRFAPVLWGLLAAALWLGGGTRTALAQQGKVVLQPDAPMLSQSLGPACSGEPGDPKGPEGPGGGPSHPKQGTRMLKAECPCDEEDPYILRLTRKQADRGMPDCGLCHKPMRLAD